MTRQEIIKKIQRIIEIFGLFTVEDVNADSSPIVADSGQISHLAELFDKDTVEVFSYHCDMVEEIDRVIMTYEDLDDQCLEDILELAEKWQQIGSEEEE